MNSRELRNRILSKSPRYAASKKEILEKISNKTGKAGQFNLGPFYQAYLYSFFVGYNLDRREELPISTNDRSEFRQIKEWGDIPEALINQMLMFLLLKTDLNWFELEDAEEKEVHEFVNELIKLLEEYANGGLAYLQEEFEKDSSISMRNLSYVAILQDIVNGKDSTSLK